MKKIQENIQTWVSKGLSQQNTLAETIKKKEE